MHTKERFSLISFACITIAHDDGVWAVAWSRNGNKILTGSVDTTVKLWDPESASCKQTFTGHKLAIISLDIDTSGTRKSMCCSY